MRFKQSESTPARRWIMFFCADDDSADNYAPKTGLSFGSGDLKVAKAGTAWANATGTTANGRAVEIGGGWYWYQFEAAELDTLGAIGLLTNVTDVYSSGASAEVVAVDQYNAASGGMSNLDATVSGASRFTIAGLLDEADTIEPDITLRGALRLMLAVLAGTSSGAGTGTEIYRAAGSTTKARVTVTISSNNRTAILTDITDA